MAPEGGLEDGFTVSDLGKLDVISRTPLVSHVATVPPDEGD